MRIRKGTHAPLTVPKPLVGKSMVAYQVTFTESCAYDIGKDQGGINRLFGIGYFPDHRKNSVSYGWRYNHGLIELMAHWYHNGHRYADKVKDLEIGKPYILKLHILRDWHALNVEGTSLNLPVMGRSVGFLLGPRLKRRAPHTMEIKMESL